MRINTNVASLNSQRILNNTTEQAGKLIGQLSSGLRINNASDDAAGLAISNKLSATVRSLQQASRNADQANSVMQIMSGGATQVESILERMKELATQSNSDTVDSSARTQLNNEFTSLQSEIGRITSTTQFNGRNLIDGSFGNTVNSSSTFKAAVGTKVSSVSITNAAAATYTLTSTVDGTTTIDDGNGNSETLTTDVAATGAKTYTSKFGFSFTADAGFVSTAITGETLTVDPGNASFMVSSSGSYGDTTSNDLLSFAAVNLKADSTGLNVDATSTTIDTAANAQTALTSIDKALDSVNTALGNMGAFQNRIGFATQNTQSLIQNTQAAESSIKDADMAQTMSDFSKTQILQQAGTAMLAQANSAPQLVLKLLG